MPAQRWPHSNLFALLNPLSITDERYLCPYSLAGRIKIFEPYPCRPDRHCKTSIWIHYAIMPVVQYRLANVFLQALSCPLYEDVYLGAF